MIATEEFDAVWASDLVWPGGPQHHDRHLSWLVAAGATDTAVRLFPRVGFSGEPEVTAYVVQPGILTTGRQPA